MIYFLHGSKARHGAQPVIHRNLCGSDHPARYRRSSGAFLIIPIPNDIPENRAYLVLFQGRKVLAGYAYGRWFRLSDGEVIEPVEYAPETGRNLRGLRRD